MDVRVPFLDLKSLHSPIKEEILEKISSIIDRSAFVLGAEVAEFEESFAKFIGSKYCIGVGSGFDALKLALQAAEVAAGDEVILPANTFIATAYAVSALGATPVLVDCLESSSNIDPTKIEAAITNRTKAILPVHLHGQAADMEAIQSIAEKHKIPVIEDAAQAHGAVYNGVNCGSIGKAGCFSFYPGKNLGSMGEGGAITTDDNNFAEKIRILRDVGQKKKYQHVLLGHNSRLHAMQAAILNIKLRDLAAQNSHRQDCAKLYKERLSSLETIFCPQVPQDGSHVFHLFVIHLKDPADREKLQTHLGERGVHSGLHYPVPIHLQESYKSLGYSQGDFPVSESLAQSLLSLPIFPGMTEDQVNIVADEIHAYFS